MIALPESLRPDLEAGRAFLARQSFPGKLVQCGLTGAHYYGFPSPDSDLDLKGVHVSSTRALLGLSRVAESFDRLTVADGLEMDVTTHEVRRALELLLSGNGNVLERLTTPFQLFDTPEARALAQLAQGSVSQVFSRHYMGFFRGCRRIHDEKRQLKSMLYSYRVALTGIHLLRTGAIVGDLRELAPRYGRELVLPLVARKGEAGEHAVLSPAEDADIRAGWPALESDLAAALAESPLPALPPNRAEAERWLLELRGL